MTALQIEQVSDIGFVVGVGDGARGGVGVGGGRIVGGTQALLQLLHILRL